MSAGHASGFDSQTEAAKAVAWLIVFNKPFYPLYVWWLTGSGFQPAALMLISTPLFAVLPILARRHTLWLRAGVPALGIFDTVLAQAVFSGGAGATLFLAPCALLVGVALRRSEVRLARTFAISLLLIAIVPWSGASPALHPWSSEDIATILSLNRFSVACLSAFILWRFSSAENEGENGYKEPRTHDRE